MIDCFVLSEEGDWFLFIGDQKLLHHGLLGSFSGRKGSPVWLAVRWFMRSMQS